MRTVRQPLPRRGQFKDAANGGQTAAKQRAKIMRTAATPAAPCDVATLSKWATILPRCSFVPIEPDARRHATKQRGDNAQAVPKRASNNTIARTIFQKIFATHLTDILCRIDYAKTFADRPQTKAATPKAPTFDVA
jgi:hypothetical protein